MKMNKTSKDSSNNDDDLMTCPVCGAELLPTLSIKVSGTPVTLYKEMGEIYECTAPECGLYFLKVNSKLEQVTTLELLKTQSEITARLAAEKKAVRAEVFPMAASAAERSELGRALSRLLWTFTTENIFHRAYSIEELYKACTSLGVNPSDVNNNMIPIVFTWLKENLD